MDSSGLEPRPPRGLPYYWQRPTRSFTTNLSPPRQITLPVEGPAVTSQRQPAKRADLLRREPYPLALFLLHHHHCHTRADGDIGICKTAKRAARMGSGWRGILGFEYGIVQAPLGPDISGPELAAAVANAGGIGLVRLPEWPAPDRVRELIRKTRSLTARPFGVSLFLASPQEENFRAVLEEKVAVLQVYWGEFPKEQVEEAHRAGVKVLHQIGSLDDAVKAKEAGVDGIIVQGYEAGGHVIGQEGLLSLLPKVVDLVSDTGTTVIAAGGIVDGRGYVAALALGAQGVCLGTRFLATEESFAHPLYKQKIIEMNRTDYTNLFGRARWHDAPHRVLETPFYAEWKKKLSDLETEENQPVIGHSIIHGVHKDVNRLAGSAPNATATGDIASMVMYAGQGVGLITEIIPAGEVVKRLVAEAKHVIREKLSDHQ